MYPQLLPTALKAVRKWQQGNASLCMVDVWQADMSDHEQGSIPFWMFDYLQEKDDKKDFVEKKEDKEPTKRLTISRKLRDKGEGKDKEHKHHKKKSKGLHSKVCPFCQGLVSTTVSTAQHFRGIGDFV